MKRSSRLVKPIRPKFSSCYFCKGNLTPNYLEVVDLSKFLSERGRILSRDRGGLCAKHQRQLALAIKRSRHLALLGFSK